MTDRSTMRTYRLPTTANRGKLDAVAAVLPWWQRGLVHVQYIQVRKLKAGQTELGWLQSGEKKSLPSYLSQRQWNSVTSQVNAVLAAWQTAAKVGLRAVIRALRFEDEELRRQLYRINARKAWWAVDCVLDARHGVMVSEEALRMSTVLANEWLRKHPFPNLSEVRTMAMDGTVARVSVSDKPHADYWVKVSTLEKRNPVSIPLRGYDYFNDAPGEVRNFCQISVSTTGDVCFTLVKKSQPTQLRIEGESVGLDWGLRNIFATSGGKLLGQTPYRWLCERDTELNDLAVSLQRQGIRLRDSKRYARLNRRIREYVRNEVGRILNRLAGEDIREMVVEELDFRMGGLSRRLNRIMSRAGRATVGAKLASLVETRGITVTKVNSAHTSRCCSGCGYVDKKNRISQERFSCRFCGKKLHADINAARNILGRSQGQGGLCDFSKEQVLAEMDWSFRARWRIEPTLLRERSHAGAVPLRRSNNDVNRRCGVTAP
ncbi:RNA-guided endonuclease InsQ/TnpB family protein [Nocardia sp. NPDC101769]|uniref:RNA-guided endonuclease InsQ/TnpB family protein n=1 Tax=Nocardia sp. NPDC101769 TaxID=3364333 RepID=UPI0038175302